MYRSHHPLLGNAVYSFHVAQEIQDNDDLKIMKKQKKISSLLPATFNLYTLPRHLLAQGGLSHLE